MASYTSEYPSIPFDPAYKKFFEGFYATSDTPEAHDKYVDHFTKDATLIMASKKAKGSEGLQSPLSLHKPALIMPRNTCPPKGSLGEGQ